MWLTLNPPYGGVPVLLRALVGGRRDHHVAKRQRTERLPLDRAVSVHGLDLDLGQGEKLAVRSVQIVAEPAPVTVRRQPEQAGDPVALGLGDDLLQVLLHARRR